MLDWGIGLAVGVGTAVVSEVALLMAIITPRFPIHKGRTWRGTVYGVTTVSAIVGGIAGFIATQFGGFGGGGSNVPGRPSPVASRTASTPAPPQPTKPEAAPRKPDSYLASYVDLYFLRDEKTQLTKDFEGEVVVYRWKEKQWKPEFQRITEKSLKPFLGGLSIFLEQDEKGMLDDERANRRLRVFLKPFPGDGAFDQIKQAAESRGWKVDRKDAPWQAELPAS